MTLSEMVGTGVVLLGALGFVAAGVMAYLGRPELFRRRMLGDPEGHRLAGSLWLGLLPLPVIALIASGQGEGGTNLVVFLLVVMGVLLVLMMAMAFNRPARLTRLLTPRWLLQERSRRFGDLDAAGRPLLLLRDGRR